MRLVPVLCLLVATVRAAPPPSVDRILDDHARTLGAADRVRTLRWTFSAGGASLSVKGARGRWRAPGDWVRELPSGPNQPAWIQFFSDGRACFTRGAFVRYRPDVATTRAGYYFYRLLAQPFPLLPYVKEPAARKGLTVGSAPGYEVLVGPWDAHGVRAAYLLDPKTHRLAKVQYIEQPDLPLVELTYDRYREVGGVWLPHALYGRWLPRTEDPGSKRIGNLSRPIVWQEIVDRFEIDPTLADSAFELPGRGKGGADGFERRVLATGPDPYDVGASDLDGDGKTDVAVACWGGLAIHFGGDLSHPLRVPLGKGHHHGLAIEDYDLDGTPDIITASHVEPAQTWFVVSVDKGREPRVRRMYGAPHFAYEVLASDLDRDGLADLVGTGYASRTLEIKFNNGAGGLRLVGSTWPLNREQENRRAFGVAVGDLDGDPMRDIAVADGTRVVVFRGEVNLSFQPRIALPEEQRPVATDVLFADLDEDGRDDLVIAQSHRLLDLPKDVIVIRNRDNRLAVSQELDAGARVPAIAAGYLNGDAHVDIAAASFLTGEVVLLAGDGRGALEAERGRLASGRGTCRLGVADLDGDGRDDLVAANRIDDTVTLFFNRRGGPAAPRATEPRATPCPEAVHVDFELKGLSDAYSFAGGFRLPERVLEASGIAFLGGVVNTQLVVVSDKRPALFRVVLDRSRRRLLVGPAVPLRGLEGERLDLEGVAFDHRSSSLFLACEADSSILQATLWGHVLGRAPSGIESGGNDGLEALAFHRKRDGTPLLYAFKERNGITLSQPVFRVLEPRDEPFRLDPRGADRKLPVRFVDQTGAAATQDRLFVVSRGMRAIAELRFDGDGFAKDVKLAGYGPLLDALGLQTTFGVVEGLAIDHRGDLFLVVDNNGEELGKKGLDRGRESRLLWLERKGESRVRARPAHVVVRQIHVPFPGPDATPPAVARAEKIAREVLRRARAGEDFEQLTAERHDAKSPWPAVLRIAADGVKPAPGEFRQRDLPRALACLALNLEPGETGLCEYDEEESPRGWHVLQRIE